MSISHTSRSITSLLQEEGLIATDDRIVVGFSGGVDSLCLLHALWLLRDDLQLKLHTAHLNHRLRGSESERDAEFAGSYSALLGLPCHIGEENVARLAREWRTSIEEGARIARYRFLGGVARSVNATKVAVAHHRDDQVESVVMHFLRGTGLAGLRGMLPRCFLSELRLEPASAGAGFAAAAVGEGTPQVELIRPLLSVPRQTIEAYCREHNLEARLDRSNLDTTYYRNRIRHELLPMLESFNPRIREVIFRTAQVAAGDVEIIADAVRRAWEEVVLSESDLHVSFNRSAWRALLPGLQRATLREAVRRLRSGLRDISYTHIENARDVATKGEVGSRATLPRNLQLVVEYDALVIGDSGQRLALPPPSLPFIKAGSEIPLAWPGNTVVSREWRLEVRELAPSREVLHSIQRADRCEAYFDADRIGRSLWLRTRRIGDRFAPLGMGGRRKRLSDFMVNEKIPQPLRHQVPLLVSEGGIHWVCGWRPAEDARVTASTRCVVHMRFVRLDAPAGHAL